MLIALHGFTETDHVWQELLHSFAPDLLCPLLPGHGGKPCPADSSLAGTAAEIASRFPAGRCCDLLGYSMGGRVAIRLALDHPERIRRLVLISSNPGMDDASERAARRLRDEHLAQILEEDGMGPFVAWWQSNPILKPAKPLSRSVAESLRCMRLNQEPLGLAMALRRLGASDDANDLWPRIHELRMPVLLVHGAADLRYKDIMTSMASRIPHARLETIADAGHAIHREQSETLVTLVRSFLA